MTAPIKKILNGFNDNQITGGGKVQGPLARQQAANTRTMKVAKDLAGYGYAAPIPKAREKKNKLPGAGR